MSKKNVTLSLTQQTVEKLKALAVGRATSVSDLMAERVEILLRQDETAYERAQRQAMTLLDQGFPMGGVIRAKRDELHKR
jgi:hypothetical protein